MQGLESGRTSSERFLECRRASKYLCGRRWHARAVAPLKVWGWGQAAFLILHFWCRTLPTVWIWYSYSFFKKKFITNDDFFLEQRFTQTPNRKAISDRETLHQRSWQASRLMCSNKESPPKGGCCRPGIWSPSNVWESNVDRRWRQAKTKCKKPKKAT